MISNDNGGEMVESEPSATGPKGQGLKKGPWSASEDAILVEYVKKHGEGNWNSVQKNSGLMRCGKSCRLRWANHLRPNLKKGSFTPEEERIIIELHAKLGNKWARMASQLPGRTDNEIKNYWNTRMKRRQRAGLPIYPKEVQKEAAAFHFQQQQQQQEQQKFPTSSSDPSLSPLLSSTHEKAPNFNPSLSLYDPTHFSAPNLDPQNNVNSSFYSNPNQQFNFFSDGSTNNGSLAFPLPSVSPYAHSPSSATLFSQNLAAQAVPSTPPSLHYDAVDFGTNISFTSLIMGAQVEPVGLINGLKSEPPSNQTPPHATNPISPSTLDNNDKDITTSATQGDINSGLLDALLLESKTLSCKGKSSHRNSPVASNKGKHVLADESKEEEEEGEVDAADAPKRVRLSLRNSSETSGENQCDDLSSFQSSMGMKSTDQEPMEEINSMDDDLLSLLNNFPSSMPLPEWYRQSREESNGSSSAVTGDVKGLQQPQQQDQDTSMTTTQGVVATNDGSPNLEWALGPRYWNNMPGIC